MQIFETSGYSHNSTEYKAVEDDEVFCLLQTLHNYGARKIALFGLGPIGCTPEEIRTFPTNLSGCVDNINNAVTLYNDRMKPLVDGLNANLSDAHFTYINVWSFSPTIGRLPQLSFINSINVFLRIYFGVFVKICKSVQYLINIRMIYILM